MRSSAKEFWIVAWAGLAYGGFLVVALWAIGFLADAGTGATVDRGGGGPAWAAILADLGLLLLFAGQHSVMARSAFKVRLARLLPAPAERAAYVLATDLVLALLFWQWRPVPGPDLWRVAAAPGAWLIWSLFAAGWVTAIAATFMVDHLDFLGLRQAGRAAAGRAYAPPAFRARWLYTRVRHPMMLGLLIAFWATPVMSAGHLLFAVAGTAYIAIGIRFEERDLSRQLGDQYRDYAARVPALFPAPRRSVP